MILRKLPLILAGTLTLLTITVNSEDSDTNDWIPIAQPSKPIKATEDPPVIQKKAQGRVLNLAEPPEANFFPEETKPPHRGNYQQYLRETSNPNAYPNPKRPPPIRHKQNPHPYRFDVPPQPQQQPLHQHQPQPLHQPQTLHQPQPLHQPQTLHQPQPLHQPQLIHQPQPLHQPQLLHQPQGNVRQQRPQFVQQQYFPQPPQGYHTIPEEEYLSQQVLLQQQGYLPDIPDLPPIRLNASVATIQALNNELLENHKGYKHQIDITSTTPKIEKENVQLLYVPLESLNQNQRPDLPRLHAYQQAPIQEIHQPFARPAHTKIQDIQNDFIQQALEAHKLQQHFQENPQPYALPIIETTIPPTTTTTRATTTTTTTTKRPTTKKRKPHQPPLAVYMGGDQNADITDVLSILKDAKSIDVQDSVGPDSPKIFVGPSTLDTPLGYAKFELPYLSSIENNRVERKVEQLPFFVAPLSYKTPNGYSKIPLPSPHVGSVVVNKKLNAEKEREEHQKQIYSIRNQQKIQEEDVAAKQVYTQQNQLRGQNVHNVQNLYTIRNPQQDVYTQQKQVYAQNEDAVYKTQNGHFVQKEDDDVPKQVYTVRNQGEGVYDQQQQQKHFRNQLKPQNQEQVYTIRNQGEDAYNQQKYQDEEAYTQQKHLRLQQQRQQHQQQIAQKPAYTIRNHEEEAGYAQQKHRNQPVRQQHKDGLRYQSAENEDEVAQKQVHTVKNQEEEVYTQQKHIRNQQKPLEGSSKEVYPTRNQEDSIRGQQKHKNEKEKQSAEDHGEEEPTTIKYSKPIPDRHVINQFELDQINSFIPQYEVQQAPEKYALDGFPQHYTSRPTKEETVHQNNKPFQASKPLTSQEQFIEEVRPEDKNNLDSIQQTRNAHVSSTKSPQQYLKEVDYGYDEKPSYVRSRPSSTPSSREEYSEEVHTRPTRRRTRPTTTTSTPPQQYLKETHYERASPAPAKEVHYERPVHASPAPVRQPPLDDYHRSRQQYEDLNTKYTIESNSDDQEGFIRSSTPVPRQQYHDVSIKSSTPLPSQQYQEGAVRSSTPFPRQQYQEGSVRSSTPLPRQQYQEGVRSSTQQYQEGVRSSTPRYQDGSIRSSTVLPRQQYDSSIRSSTQIPDDHYVDIDVIKSQAYYSPKPTVLTLDSEQLYAPRPTQNTYTDFDTKDKTKKPYVDEVENKGKGEDVRLPVYNPTERAVHQNQHIMNQHVLDSKILGKTSVEPLVNRNRQQYYTHEETSEENVDIYNLPQETPQNPNHQIYPNLINNLEDQSVRQLLQPGLIPTSSRLTEGGSYASTRPPTTTTTTTTTTTEAPSSTYPSTHYPVVETTTKRTRGRQRGNRYSTTTQSSAYSTTRRTSSRGRRPLPPRTRYQEDGPTTAYPVRSTTDPTKRIVTARSRFRTRGRPQQQETTTTEKQYYDDVSIRQPTGRVLENDHSTTPRLQLLDDQIDYSSERYQPYQQQTDTPKIQQYQSSLAQSYDEYYPNVKVQQYHPSSTPKVEQYHPSVTSKLEQYHASVTPKIEQYHPSIASKLEEYRQQSVTPKIEQYHSTVTPKVVNVEVTRPVNEPVVIQQINHSPVRNYEETTTAKTTRGRPRIRSRTRITTTTRAPARRQETTTAKQESDEFYGFFREPNFKKPPPQPTSTEPPQRPIYSSTYVSSTFRPGVEYADDPYIQTSSLRYQTEVEENPSTPIQFLGEIRPKYSSSTPQYFEVSPTGVEVRKPLIQEADVSDKVKIRGRIRVPSRRVTTEESVTPQRGRTRGKSHYKPKPKPKDSSEDEDVEGGNYPPQFKTQPTPRPPSFQITIDPNFDDQEPYASIIRQTYVAKESNNKEDSAELQGNYQSFNDIRKEEKFSTVNPINEEVVEKEEDKSNEEIRMYQQFLDELTRIKESGESVETTTLEVDPTTKARRRGVWKLVKRPVDVLEGAESQNIANIKANSFDDDEKIKNKESKGKIQIVETSKEVEDEVVTTERNVDTTSTTTEASLFGSLYEMFGLTGHEAELNDEPAETTMLNARDEEVTTLPAVAETALKEDGNEEIVVGQYYQDNEKIVGEEPDYSTFRPADLIEEAQRINAMEESNNQYYQETSNQYPQETQKSNNQYDQELEKSNNQYYQETQNPLNLTEEQKVDAQEEQKVDIQEDQKVNVQEEPKANVQEVQKIEVQEEKKFDVQEEQKTPHEGVKEDHTLQTEEPLPLTTTHAPMTYITPMSLETWNLGILKTSTSTEISHETEICYKGRCIKSKDMKVPMT